MQPHVIYWCDTFVTMWCERYMNRCRILNVSGFYIFSWNVAPYSNSIKMYCKSCFFPFKHISLALPEEHMIHKRLSHSEMYWFITPLEAWDPMHYFTNCSLGVQNITFLNRICFLDSPLERKCSSQKLFLSRNGNKLIFLERCINGKTALLA